MATTSEVAKALGVSPPTIRTYTQQFSEHLSPAASPPPGQQRRFTQQDVATLNAAKSLLDEGLTYQEANARLGVVDVQDLEPPPSEPEPTALVPANTVRLIVEPYVQERDRALSERDQALDKVESLQRQVGRLEGQLEALQRPWWRRLLGQ